MWFISWSNPLSQYLTCMAYEIDNNLKKNNMERSHSPHPPVDANQLTKTRERKRSVTHGKPLQERDGSLTYCWQTWRDERYQPRYAIDSQTQRELKKVSYLQGVVRMPSKERRLAGVSHHLQTQTIEDTKQKVSKSQGVGLQQHNHNHKNTGEGRVTHSLLMNNRINQARESKQRSVKLMVWWPHPQKKGQGTAGGTATN